MDLFNQNYHIQILVYKLQLEKQKTITKTWGAREILWKDH